MIVNLASQEFLSLEDIDQLNDDLPVFAIVIKWGRLITTVVVGLCCLSWYNAWTDGWFRFLSTVASALYVVWYFAIMFHTRKIRDDLRKGIKITEVFHLKRKLILCTRDTRIDGIRTRGKSEAIVQREILEELIQYKRDKALRQASEKVWLDQMLRYEFKFIVLNPRMTRVEEFLVPIEYFMSPKEGSDLKITFAQKSRKVFQVS